MRRRHTAAAAPLLRQGGNTCGSPHHLHRCMSPRVTPSRFLSAASACAPAERTIAIASPSLTFRANFHATPSLLPHRSPVRVPEGFVSATPLLDRPGTGISRRLLLQSSYSRAFVYLFDAADVSSLSILLSKTDSIFSRGFSVLLRQRDFLQSVYS